MASAPATPSLPAAHERLYRALRTRIMLGELPPGKPLTLRGIAAESRVSMTPAREAVRRLVAEGALSLSASGRVATPELSVERIEELAALRALIEPELAARALPPLLYGADSPYGRSFTGSGDDATLKALTRADLVAEHDAWVRPDNATIFVVSDQPLSAITPQLETAFGDWRAPSDGTARVWLDELEANTPDA